MFLIVLSLLGILFQNVSGNTSSCNTEDLRTCRADALEQMSGSSSGDSVQQERQCRNLRENFDCVLWQTSMCLKEDEQDSNSDVIMKTLTYLGGFCEKYINWWARSCFQRDDVKRCESLLPSKRNSLDSQSCRMFVNFRDCVTSIASSSCSNSDRNLLGSYFTKKGQQMAWRCPKDSSDVGSLPQASAQQIDRRYPNNMYGDSAGDSACLATARTELSDCQLRFENTQNEAARRDDSDMRNHKLCCAMVAFEQCLNAATETCGITARGVVKDILESTKTQANVPCKEIVESCQNGGDGKNGEDGKNGGDGIIPCNVAAMYFLLYLGYFLFVKAF